MSKILGKHTAFPGKKIGHDHTSGAAQNLGANDLHWYKFTATENATVTRMSAFKAAQSVGIKSVCGIYSDSAGLPSTKLGQTNEHTNALAATGSAVGGLTIYTLQSPVNLVKGQVYWLAYHQDTSALMENAYNGPTSGLFIYKTITYNATMPTSVSAPFTTAGANPSLAAY